MKAPFEFLEWWGMKAPFELFGVVGYCRPLEFWEDDVLETPLDFWVGGVLPTPLDFWKDGALSTPLDFWAGGVLSTPLAFWLRVGYFPLNALERLLRLGRQSWSGQSGWLLNDQWSFLLDLSMMWGWSCEPCPSKPLHSLH